MRNASDVRLTYLAPMVHGACLARIAPTSHSQAPAALPAEAGGEGQEGKGTALAADGQRGPDLPFIPDEDEDRVISAASQAESMLLVGRSGTGKTSILVGRMFAMYTQWRQRVSGGYGGGVGEVAAVREHEGYHQLFVTASAVLRDQVRRSFAALRDSAFPPAAGCGQAEGSAGVGRGRYHTMGDVEEGSWPLFLTRAEWLRMLDGSLDQPFFARAADGSLR